MRTAIGGRWIIEGCGVSKRVVLLEYPQFKCKEMQITGSNIVDFTKMGGILGFIGKVLHLHVVAFEVRIGE